MIMNDDKNVVIDFISKPFFSFFEESDAKKICIIEFKDLFYNTICSISTTDIEIYNLI